MIAEHVQVGAEKRWGDGVGSVETTPSEPYRRATEVVGEALGISRAQYERARARVSMDLAEVAMTARRLALVQVGRISHAGFPFVIGFFIGLWVGR